MKKLLSILFICSLSISSFAQEAKSSSDQEAKYKNVDTDAKFYPLFDSCPENSKVDGCWKLGLNWDSEESDYSKVSRSKMHFYYLPKNSLNCPSLVFYELTPNSKTGAWTYKNQNITINVKMMPVETAFGQQLSEIRITNLGGESCNGPKTVLKKF